MTQTNQLFQPAASVSGLTRMPDGLTPTERLLLLSLRLKPSQDASELLASTGVALGSLHSSLRTLRVRGMIVRTHTKARNHDEKVINTITYTLAEVR